MFKAVQNHVVFLHQSVFPQLKNKFPGMDSEISWNSSQFPEIEEG